MSEGFRSGLPACPLIILAGPTAVGKTELSLDLAEVLNAEIISADSRQIYKELTIGTAKPSKEELSRIRHHFIDELTLREPYSAGKFQRDAGERSKDILRRGRQPLVVGGSTLYLRALTHGLAEIPDVPSTIRAMVSDRLAHEGPAALYADLQRIDPESAGTMDSTKSQRHVRALEVYAATGIPLSHFHRMQGGTPGGFHLFVLNRERRELYERIDRRVDQMLEKGLLQEVAGLLENGHDTSLNPLRTIGYQEPIAHLRGEISFDEMTERIKRNSRRYAKRQLTWFRRDETNIWLDAGHSHEKLIDEIISLADG